MSKGTQKQSRQEEQRKAMVRIICLVLVVVMAVTSLLAVFPMLFNSGIDPELQAMIDAGYAYVDEDGTIYLTQEYIDLMTGDEPDAGDGHDHDHQ